MFLGPEKSVERFTAYFEAIFAIKKCSRLGIRLFADAENGEVGVGVAFFRVDDFGGMEVAGGATA